MESKMEPIGESSFCDDTLFNRMFEEILNIEDSSDVKIKVDSMTISAHRIVLAAASPFFKALLYGKMSESTSKEVKISDIDSYTLKAIIDYMYSRKVLINTQNVVKLLEGASFLQMMPLKGECENFMIKQINENIVIGFAKFAERMSCSKLLDASNEYIAFNFEKVSHSEEFNSLDIEELLTLIQRDDLIVNEEDLFEACLRWMNLDTENRNKFADKIFKFVRFPLMNLDYLTKNVKTNKLIQSLKTYDSILGEACTFHMFPQLRLQMENNQRMTARGVRSGELYVFGLWHFEVFNPTKQTWRNIQSMPSKARDGYGAAILNGRLYIIGGYVNGCPSSSVEIYDPHLGSWVKGSDMLTQRRGHAVCVLNNTIYVCGGFNTAYLNSVESYCPKTNVWRLVKSMKTCRAYFSAVALNGNIFVTAGSNGNVLHTVEMYNTTSNAWEDVAGLSNFRQNHGAATLNDNIYVCGGEYGGATNMVEVYDYKTNLWSLGKPMKFKRRGLILCEYMNKIWAIGGHDGVGYLSSVEIYDPIENNWSDGPEMISTKAYGFAGEILKQPMKDV